MFDSYRTPCSKSPSVIPVAAKKQLSLLTRSSIDSDWERSYPSSTAASTSISTSKSASKSASTFGSTSGSASASTSDLRLFLHLDIR